MNCRVGLATLDPPGCPGACPAGLATLDPPYEPWSEVHCVSVSNDAVQLEVVPAALQTLVSSAALAWIFRTAAAICSMSDRVPRNMVWINQTASWHKLSLAGQWLRSP